LVLDIPDSKPIGSLGETHMIPSNETLGAMTSVVPSPEEGTTAGINCFLDRFGKKEGRHVMDGEATQYRIEENHTVARAKEFSLPTSQVAVEGGDERLIVRHF
jgi:hypothetical protein